MSFSFVFAKDGSVNSLFDNRANFFKFFYWDIVNCSRTPHRKLPLYRRQEYRVIHLCLTDFCYFVLMVFSN